jgi:hypothetical protein
MLEKLKSYYSFSDRNGNLIVSKVEDNNKQKIVPCNNEPFYFTFEHRVKTIDEAEQLIAEGKGFKVLCVDIHREFYGLDDEALCMKMHGYDLRTEKYLKAVKENIGFIEEKHGWDDEKINNPQTISIWANASDVEIGQTEDDRWCAQWSVRTAVDDYCISRLYFNRKPTRNDILTVHKLSDLEMNFGLHRMKPVFECWECGRKVHWLDIEGDFNEKLTALNESYCGC